MKTTIEQKLLNHADTIEIPDELDLVVQRAIKKGTSKKERLINMNKWTKCVAAAAVIVISFVGATNLSPTFAKSLSDIPVLKDIVKVVSFRQFDFEEDTYSAHLESPVLEGLENKTLQDMLNNQYIEENKKLFKEFESEVAQMKSFDTQGHVGLDSGFEIKTNNDQILSIARYVVNTVGSSSTTMTYNTLDKQNEILITLPSLFKDDSYIEVISENIISQMREKMTTDENQVYWIAGDPDAIDGFEAIDANQNFYISDTGKLIISFDKYIVGPGSMGIQEFEIPTDSIQDILVSNTYIK